MAEKTLHSSGGSHVIKFEEENHDIKNLVHRWEHNMKPEEIARIMHDAKHAPEGKLHLNDGKHSLVHHGDGTYTIERRSHIA